MPNSKLRRLSHDASMRTFADVASTTERIPHSLAGLPLETRLLLAILRLASHGGTLPMPARQILDSLGQVLDAGPERDRRIASLNALNETVLVRTTRRLDIGSAPSSRLSEDERLLVGALTRLADGHRALDDGALSEVMGREVRLRLQESATHVLGANSLHGLRERAGERDRHSAGTERGTPLGAEPTAAAPIERSVLECADLSLREAVVLALPRLWVRGIVTGFDSVSAVRLLCAHLGLPRLGDVVSTVLHRASRDAHHRIDVRCLCCAELSPDEARLLAALSALGRRRLTEYHDHLCAWLPSAWARSVTMLTAEGDALGELGRPLPRRNWDFALLTARQPLFDATGNTTAHTVH